MVIGDLKAKLRPGPTARFHLHLSPSQRNLPCGLRTVTGFPSPCEKPELALLQPLSSVVRNDVTLCPTNQRCDSTKENNITQHQTPKQLEWRPSTLKNLPPLIQQNRLRPVPNQSSPGLGVVLTLKTPAYFTGGKIYVYTFPSQEK